MITSLSAQLFQPHSSPGQLPHRLSAQMAFNLLPGCQKTTTSSHLYSSKICPAHLSCNTKKPRISGNGSTPIYTGFPTPPCRIKLQILKTLTTKCTLMAPPTWRPATLSIRLFQKVTSIRFRPKSPAVCLWSLTSPEPQSFPVIQTTPTSDTSLLLALMCTRKSVFWTTSKSLMTSFSASWTTVPNMECFYPWCMSSDRSKWLIPKFLSYIQTWSWAKRQNGVVSVCSSAWL